MTFVILNKIFWLPIQLERIHRDVVANVLDCDIIVSEFDLKSGYYV